MAERDQDLAPCLGRFADRLAYTAILKALDQANLEAAASVRSDG